MPPQQPTPADAPPPLIDLQENCKTSTLTMARGAIRPMRYCTRTPDRRRGFEGDV
jgi:hypothetical protein